MAFSELSSMQTNFEIIYKQRRETEHPYWQRFCKKNKIIFFDTDVEGTQAIYPFFD